jgi:ESX secretion system protein EccE
MTTAWAVRRRFPVRPGHVAVWQLAAAGAILAGGPGTVRGAVAAGLAVLAVAVTAVRWRGRWAYQWLWLVVRRLRRDPGGPIEAVLPALRIQTYADRAGNRTGVAGDGRFYTAVVRVGRPDPDRLLTALYAAYRRTDPPVAAVQAVHWTVPVPGADPVRTCWLAVRFAPAAAPAAVAARGGGESGAVRAATVAALALARDLADAGLPVTVLDGTELRSQLAVALGVSPGSAVRLHESWRGLELGGLRQTCYRPRTGDPAATLAAAAAEPAAFTAASVTLTRPVLGPAGARPDIRHLIRVGSAIGTPIPLGTPVDRLDGDHTRALRQTLPLALL